MKILNPNSSQAGALRPCHSRNTAHTSFAVRAQLSEVKSRVAPRPLAAPHEIVEVNLGSRSEARQIKLHAVKLASQECEWR